VVDYHTPKELAPVLDLKLGDEGASKAGLLDLVERTLQYSVNTWDQGFMDKLYASTNPVGVISELVLGVLNTNVRLLCRLH
jgi:glutamate decarboxylase